MSSSTEKENECNLSFQLLLGNKGFRFRSIQGLNYPFDVLLHVLLFQVKKQEIYREVNWPQDALLR